MNWHVDISGTIALRGLFVDGGAEAAVKAYLSNFVAGHGGNNYVVSMAANSNVTMSRCAVTQLFASGTGVIQTAGSSFTALRSIFDVPAAAGYAVKGAGTFIYASDVFLQSANVQNTLSLTTYPLVPTAVP